MANHKSSKKRIRQSEARRTENKYYAKSMRNSLKELRETKDKAKAEEELPKVGSLIDRLAKKGVIHKNKASNLKSQLAKQVNSI